MKYVFATKRYESLFKVSLSYVLRYSFHSINGFMMIYITYVAQMSSTISMIQ